MSEDGLYVELKPLNLPIIDRERSSDSGFLSDLVTTGNELCYALKLCLAQMPTSKLAPRHQAVLTGLMVRLYKLYDTFQMLTCAQRMEMSMIIGRSATDTAIDIIYLCKKCKTELLDEFIRTSLTGEKEMYELMLQDEEKGKGDAEIRKRIKSSIESDFGHAGFTISDIDSTKWRRKHSTRQRAQLCEIENLYLLLYKNLSRITHGSWSEIMKYHVESDGDSWSANIEHAIPRPQLVGSLPILVAIAGIAYSDSLTDNTALSDRFQEIIDWFMKMSRAHEDFLNG